MFIAERHDYPLATLPVLGVADSTAFVASRPPQAWDFAKPFTREHWGVVEVLVRDPDDIPGEVARVVALGATHIHDKAEFGLTWTTLADPEGNEFCIGSPHH